MMGERLVMQESLFYAFRLEDHVPSDHLLRSIDRFVDCSELRQHLAGFYSTTGRPSIDPELMIRMLLIGYCLGIRSERRLCEEVHLNLAYRWFCRLGLEGKVPDHSTFSKNRHGRFRESDLFRHLFEAVVQRCMDEGLVGGEGFAVDASLIQADANKQRSLAGIRLASPGPYRTLPRERCGSISPPWTRPPGVRRPRLSRSSSHPLIRRLNGPVRCVVRRSLPMRTTTSSTSSRP